MTHGFGKTLWACVLGMFILAAGLCQARSYFTGTPDCGFSPTTVQWTLNFEPSEIGTSTCKFDYSYGGQHYFPINSSSTTFTEVYETANNYRPSFVIYTGDTSYFHMLPYYLRVLDKPFLENPLLIPDETVVPLNTPFRLVVAVSDFVDHYQLLVNSEPVTGILPVLSNPTSHYLSFTTTGFYNISMVIYTSSGSIETNSVTVQATDLLPTEDNTMRASPSAVHCFDQTTAYLKLSSSYVGFFRWNLGGGHLGESSEFQRYLAIPVSYSSTGYYNHTLTINDAYGNHTFTNWDAVEVLPENQNLNTLRLLPSSGYSPNTVKFIVNLTPTVTEWKLDFDDGDTGWQSATESRVTIDHFYAEADYYFPQLIVHNTFGFETITQPLKLTLENTPTLPDRFNINKYSGSQFSPLILKNSLPCNFYFHLDSTAIRWKMNYGLGEGEWETVNRHFFTRQFTYTTNGDYSPQLIVEKPYSTDTYGFNVKVTDGIPSQASYFSLSFTGSALDSQQEIVGVHLAPEVTEWKFVLGPYDMGWKTVPSLKYSQLTINMNTPGIYDANLYVRYSYGTETVTSKSVIKIYQQANIGSMGIFASPNQGYAPLETEFALRSDSNLYGYEFHYSGKPENISCDFNTVTKQITYSQPGTYSPYIKVHINLGIGGVYSYDLFHYRNNHIQVYDRSSTASTIDLPMVKAYKNQAISTDYVLSDYRPFRQNYVYFVGSNPLGLSSLSGNTILYNGYPSSTTVEYHYGISYQETPIRLIRQKLQVSTYQIKKLSEINLSPGESYDLSLKEYTFDQNGNAWPASYGRTGSILIDPLGQVMARWYSPLFSRNTVLRITALSGFTTETRITVFASPSVRAPFADVDQAVIVIKPRAQQIGQFATISQFNQNYVVHQLSDYPVLPANIAVPETGTLRVTLASGQSGCRIMPNLGNFVNYQKNTWYTAKMRVRASQSNSFVEAHLYNMKGIVPGDAHVEGNYNMVLGISTAWTLVEMPLYTHQAGSGYFQIYLKNPGATSTDVYIKDIQVVEETPTLAQPWNLEKISVYRPWTYQFQRFGTPTQYWGNEIQGAVNLWSVDQQTQTLYGNSSGINRIKITAVDTTTGIISTPAAIPGGMVGMRARVSMTNLNRNYEDLFMMSCMGVQRPGEYNIWEKGNQILGLMEFGQVTDGEDTDSMGRHILAGNALCPYYQYQVQVKFSDLGLMELKDVAFLPGTSAWDTGNDSLY